MSHLGENWPSCWNRHILKNRHIWKNRSSCVYHNCYIQIYLNLYLVISPSRAPPSQIYLWNTFRRPANAFAFLVTSPYLSLYVHLLSAYKTKPVINMIIKRNLKNKCMISVPALSYTCSLFTSGNPNLCAYESRLWGLISLYSGLTYMTYIRG